MKRKLLYSLGVFLPAAMLVFGGGSAAIAEEAGTETVTEASSEAGTEAETEASSETGTEAETEASSEAVTEASSEAGAEAESGSRDIFLSDIDYVLSGDGRANLDGGMLGSALALQDENGEEVTFDKGIYTGGTATLVYDLTGYGAQRFQAEIGILEESGENGITFSVKADGQEIYAQTITDTKGITSVDVEIPEGTKELILENEKLSETSGWGGGAIWGNAVLVCDNEVLNTLNTVTVQPKSPSVAVGESVDSALEAYTNYREVLTLEDGQYHFTSSDPSVAEVDESTGAVTGVADGFATITCEVTVGDVTQSASYDIIVGEGVQDKAWTVSSPSGEITALFYMKDDGSVSFAAASEGKTVIAGSPTGLETSLGDFSSGLEFTGREDEEVSDSYDLVGAKVSHVDAAGNQMTLHFTKDGVSYDIVVRVYDDGIGFRYVINGEEGTELTIQAENTGMLIASGSVAQAMEYEAANESVVEEVDSYQLKGSYSMPLFYETPEGTCVLISEADLNSSYCGAQLIGDGTGMVQIAFTPEQTEDVQTTADFSSPWRFAVIGTAADVVENTMAETLSEPCKLEDTSWIEPGTVDWTWLNGDLRHYNTNLNWEEDAYTIYKEYVDFAAEMGWEYQLLDEGWQPSNTDESDDSIYKGYYDWTEDLIEYANEKGVGLIVWANSADLNTEEKRERIAEWAEMGFKGIKADFFDSQSQDTILLIEQLMEETAENQLLLNLHGAAKPTGERRTYPQVLAREGVFGAEQSLFNGSNVSARLNCSLPFTRNAVGPMDYTPTASYGINGENRPYTLAHLTALPVVYEVGLQCMADTPDIYREHVAYEHYFKDMPSEWDETVLVDGDPGDYVNIARKNGDDWYQGIICDGERAAEFDLDFLGEGTYMAYIYQDGEDPMTEVAEQIVEVTGEDHLSIELAETGGAAIHYVKQ